MDVRPVLDTGAAPLALSASFNDPLTGFSVGTETGFCVFSAETSSLTTSRNLDGGIGLCQMLGNYNYVALVGGGRNPRWAPTKMILWNDAKQKAAATLEQNSIILNVCLTKAHIAVVLRNNVVVYSLSSTIERTGSYETTENPLGLCCLDAEIVAFPGRSPGKLQLIELKTGNVSIIPAHTGSLRAIGLSKNGQFLATASESGTLVRVFSTVNCARLVELRRGIDQAFVFSIAFSPDSHTLAVSSDKATLHVFDISKLVSNKSPNEQRLLQTTQLGYRASLTEDQTEPNKWGVLAKLPLLPRIFADTYSFSSAAFDMGHESGPSGANSSPIPALGSSLARPRKGTLGWLDNETILCIGTGRGALWEKFKIGLRSYTLRTGLEEIRREVWREGHKTYLGV